MKCPKCETENEAGNAFCNKCGAKLRAENTSQAAPQNTQANVDESVKSVIVKRLDAIKNKDEAAVTGLMDDGYSKFDDWAPYQRQERPEALKNEFSAFKVLSNYTYEIKDLKTNVLGDAAIATFIIHYQAMIRDQKFDVTSRVTAALRRQDSSWKLIHEHFSRFPTQTQGSEQQHRRRMFPF